VTLELTVLATTYEVDAPPELLAALQALFPAAPAVARRRGLRLAGDTVLLDDAPVAPVPTPADALDALLMALNARSVGDSPGLSVHAGVVARGAVAVAFPGASGQGKSTLTAACLRAGLDYASDEALVLPWNGAGAVLPYLKPLTLSAWSAAEAGVAPPRDGRLERAVPPGELGAACARPPLRLGHLLLLERGGGPATLEPAARADGAAALLRNAFNHYAAPARALALAGAAMGEAACWTLRYDRPGPAAALVAELLA
jgi:hypothetical protein